MSVAPEADSNVTYDSKADSNAFDATFVSDEQYFGEFDGFDDDGPDGEMLDPTIPTEAKPGSEQKVQMLAARYAAGLPLWNSSDCYDHSPGLVAALTEEEELLEYLAGEEEE